MSRKQEKRADRAGQHVKGRTQALADVRRRHLAKARGRIRRDG